MYSQHLTSLLREGRNITPWPAWKQALIAMVQLLQAQRICIVAAEGFIVDATSTGIINEICIHCNLDRINNSDQVKVSYKNGKSCKDHNLASNFIATKVVNIDYKEIPRRFPYLHNSNLTFSKAVHISRQFFKIARLSITRKSSTEI
jgi:hypothetical protein